MADRLCLKIFTLAFYYHFAVKICLSVTNDIVTDQRVNRIATSLLKLSASVTIVGRVRRTSPVLRPSGINYKRFRLLFNKGPLFYTCYNIRLFLYLLFHRFDILVANDLDTLPANYLVSRLKKNKLVYDSHEYFTEVPELVERTRVKKIWERIESVILPHIRFSYTVCSSLAKIYNNLYGIDMQVIRNLPIEKNQIVTRKELRNGEESIILYQGSVNKARGLEMVIRAMKYLDGVKLVIIGDGDIKNDLENMVSSLKLTNKVVFMGRIVSEYLHAYTVQADIGISLEENLGLNYYYALPNKLFDYIQANVPVLVSDFPEMGSLVSRYNIGIATCERDPGKIAALITDMLRDENRIRLWKQNLKKAAQELTWADEEAKLLDFYHRVISL
ncbi:MAG: glycosyltransferase [Bacteroidales bacterium]|nr:glycosyltransferase [Bacteroidales bacterium]